MADAELDDLASTATTVAPGDYLLLSQGGTAKKVTAGTIARGSTLISGRSGSRISSANYKMPVTTGPFETPGGQSTPTQTEYCIGPTHVLGGTYAKLSIHLSVAGSSGDSLFYVLYNVDADLQPTTLAWSKSFPTSNSVGYVELTGLSEVVPHGLFWGGVFAPSGNGGTPSVKGGIPSLTGHPTQGGALGTRGAHAYVQSGATTPRSDMTPILFGAAGTELTATGEGVAFLFGELA